jgi:hypothetical protein
MSRCLYYTNFTPQWQGAEATLGARASGAPHRRQPPTVPASRQVSPPCTSTRPRKPSRTAHSRPRWGRVRVGAIPRHIARSARLRRATPPAIAHRACFPSGIATLNQCTTAQTIPHRSFPPPAGAGESGSVTPPHRWERAPPARNTASNHPPCLLPAGYRHPAPAHDSANHPTPVIPAPSGGG